MIDFQIVGMPLPKRSSQRPSRGKTIQAKTRGKSLDKSKDDAKARRKTQATKGKTNVVVINKVKRITNHSIKIKV